MLTMFCIRSSNERYCAICNLWSNFDILQFWIA